MKQRRFVLSVCQGGCTAPGKYSTRLTHCYCLYKHIQNSCRYERGLARGGLLQHDADVKIYIKFLMIEQVNVKIAKPFSISMSNKMCYKFARSSHICRYFKRSQLTEVTANTWISFDGSVRTVECRLECTCLWCWGVLMTLTNRRRRETYLNSLFSQGKAKYACIFHHICSNILIHIGSCTRSSTSAIMICPVSCPQ